MLKFLNRKNRLVNKLIDEGFILQVTAGRATYYFQREAYGVVTSVLVWGSSVFPQMKINSNVVHV